MTMKMTKSRSSWKLVPLCERLQANDPDTTEANTWRSFKRDIHHDTQALLLGLSLHGNTVVTTLHLDFVAAHAVTILGIQGFVHFIESNRTSLRNVSIRCTRTMENIADRLLTAISVNGKIEKLRFESSAFTLTSFTTCLDSLRQSLHNP